MTTKKKVGRPKKVGDKIKLKYVYITDTHEKKILRKHESLSKALISIAV